MFAQHPLIGTEASAPAWPQRVVGKSCAGRADTTHSRVEGSVEVALSVAACAFFDDEIGRKRVRGALAFTPGLRVRDARACGGPRGLASSRTSRGPASGARIQN